ncbi:MAG: phosphoglycerate kinase, partial [Acidobacteria bacterium]|nr:phosphoglycerate kinase [Acidobacteriota bacterium]
MSIPYLDDLVVDGERVLVRADLNVPLVDGTVGDAFRIEASVPTIQELRRRGASVIVATHLGRPDGFDPALSTKPVAERLGELGGFPVVHAPAVIGEPVEAAIDAAGPDAVVVLENTRFEPGETTNDPFVADGLARLATYFVNDAFGAAHRAHASTEGVTRHFRQAVAGLLMERELNYLGDALANPTRPFAAILGGAKISGKIDVIKNLIDKVDLLLIGGGMTFTFAKAMGYPVGNSLVEDEKVELARELTVTLKNSRTELVFPVDTIVAPEISETASTSVVGIDKMLRKDVKTIVKYIFSSLLIISNPSSTCFFFSLTYGSRSFNILLTSFDSTT